MASPMQHEVVRYDLARGVAALIVFAAHLSQVFIWPALPSDSWLVYAAGISARAAVLAFFVLSGLLIVKSIIGNVHRNGYFDPIDYLTSRIARIYPPFIVALIMTIGVVAAVHHFDLAGSSGPLGKLRPYGLTYDPQELWQSLLLYSGLTGVNGPLWTLYIEVKLYLLAMGGALLFYGRSVIYRAAGPLIVVAVAYFLVTNADTGSGFWFFATTWAFGASLNLKSKLWIAVTSVVLIVVAFLYPPFAPTSYLDGSSLSLGSQAIACVAFAFFYLIPPYAERRWPRYLTDSAYYSYTLYVIHFPLLALGLSISIVTGMTSPFGATVSLAVTAVVTLAIVMTIAPWVENDKFFKRLLIPR